MPPANNPVPMQVVITRIFDAPRALVFQAWTQPEHITQWWGPHGFSSPHAEFDLRPGGAFTIQMADSAGNLNPTSGIIQEIDPPERLVLASKAFPDGKDGYLLEVTHSIAFEAQGDKTKLTLTTSVQKVAPEIEPAVMYMEAGWSQSFEKLVTLLDRMKGEAR